MHVKLVSIIMLSCLNLKYLLVVTNNYIVGEQLEGLSIDESKRQTRGIYIIIFSM